MLIQNQPNRQRFKESLQTLKPGNNASTRSRVSEFMQRFRNLGLIEMHPPHHLVVRDQDLSDYLTQLAAT